MAFQPGFSVKDWESHCAHAGKESVRSVASAANRAIRLAVVGSQLLPALEALFLARMVASCSSTFRHRIYAVLRKELFTRSIGQRRMKDLPGTASRKLPAV
jgi:hypothetical protein